MSCPQCFTGHVNPGTPTGHWETVYGLRTYIAEPPASQKVLGIIVIIPDAFGVGFVNNQILADHYASATQFLVYLPDFMNGILNETCLFSIIQTTNYLLRKGSTRQNNDQYGPHVG